MTSSEQKPSDSSSNEETGAEGDEIRHSAVELNKSARITTALISFSSIVAGAVAVFTTDNQAGTAVLFAGGVFGGIIALGGRLPTSIKIGDNEIKMAQARFLDAATKKVEKASPGEAGEIIASVANSAASPLSPDEAEARRQAIARRLARYQTIEDNYRRLVTTTISGWAWGKSLQLQVEEDGFDVVISGKKKTAIEAVGKPSDTPLSVMDVDRFARMVLAAPKDFDHFILVANTTLDSVGENLWSSIPALQTQTVSFITAEKHVDIANKVIPALIAIEG